MLDDEDISQAIQLELSERVKSGTLSATDLIDVVSKLGIQAQFAQAGFDKSSISERTVVVKHQLRNEC